MLRRILLIAGVTVLVGVAAAAVGLRLVPLEPERFHVDPLQVTNRGPDNSVLIAPAEAAQGVPDGQAPTYAVSPEELMLALDAAVRQMGARRIAGDPADLFATYVDRSAVMGFPDYISVRALPAPGGSSAAFFSRSRFGSYDFGVNRSRMDDWLATLSPLER